MALFGNKKELALVKVLGVRTAEETKVLATYNSTIYCLLLLYTDNTREVIECDAKTLMSRNYHYYINMNV